jgi:hypothetical protein
MYWDVEVKIHAFLISVLDGGEWSAASSGRFTPVLTAPCTQWTGSWVDPKAGLDEMVTRKNPSIAIAGK